MSEFNCRVTGRDTQETYEDRDFARKHTSDGYRNFCSGRCESCTVSRVIMLKYDTGSVISICT